MATKPEHHDVVRAFAKSLKPPIRLSLAALETLAVIAYKQPVTGPEISDIRGIESAGVLGTLLERKLITTSGRKQVIGRPMQYKTSKEFLLRFGLNEINELPSMEEFSQLVSDGIELAPAGDAEAAAEPTLFDGEGAEGQTEALENDSAENDVKQDGSKARRRSRRRKQWKPQVRRKQPPPATRVSARSSNSTPSAGRDRGRRGPRNYLRNTHHDRRMASERSERLLYPWKQIRKDYRRFWPPPGWPRAARQKN